MHIRLCGAFSSKLLLFFALATILVAESPGSAVAQTPPVGLICADTPDPDAQENDYDPAPDRFLAGIRLFDLENNGSCNTGIVAETVYDQTSALNANQVVLINNLNTSGTEGFTPGISFSFGSNVSAISFNGAAYVSGAQIPAGNTNGTFVFRFNGQSYQFQISTTGTTLSAFIIELAPSGDVVAQATVGATVMFQQAGTNISTGVANAISERFSGGDGTQASFSSDGSALSAYVSLHGLGAAGREMRAQRLAMYAPEGGSTHGLNAIGSVLPSAQDPAPRLNVWTRGTFTHFDGDDFSGDTWNGIAGVDYLVTDTVLIGVLGGYEAGDFTFQSTNGAFDGTGFSAGAYVGVQLADNLVADAFFTQSWLDYDTASGTATGSTDAIRSLFSVNLIGHYEVADGFLLEPNVRVFYAHERQDAYTMSNGSAVAANSIDSGRMSLGPRIRYVAEHPDGGHWSVHASIHGEYDLSSETQTSATLPDFDRLISARAALGLAATFRNGWMISLDGDIGGLGSGSFTSYTGSGALRIPLN